MKVTDEVYREYSQMVYKYLFSLTGDAHVAEEVTQETFYQAVRCAGRFDGSCHFSTWLCAIAKNQLNSYRRKHFVPFDDTEKPEALAENRSRKNGCDAGENSAFRVWPCRNFRKITSVRCSGQRSYVS